MLDLALPLYAFNLQYAQKLAADVAEDQLCAQPLPARVLNHPAFILGHLANTSDSALGLIGGSPALPQTWRERFGPGNQPLPDRARYPAKAELLRALEDAHARLAAAVPGLTPEALAQPAPERMRARFPTLGHLLLGMMTSHEAIHLGQLSAWRRAMGMAPAF